MSNQPASSATIIFFRITGNYFNLVGDIRLRGKKEKAPQRVNDNII